MNGSATSVIVMPVCRRVSTPSFSRASCSASALITVASIPMWSAALRSIPAELTCAPRTMLPPPTTTATSTDNRCAESTSSAIMRTVSGSMP
jgi:hypothetical protein